MADWRNRIEQITNKVKSQLFAKGVDNMNQLQDIFLVSKLFRIKGAHRDPFDIRVVSDNDLQKVSCVKL